MPGTDLKLVMKELENINATLSDHGKELKSLTKIMTSIALQKQQIDALELRVADAWVKLNAVRDYQQNCPRSQVSKLWYVLALLTTIWGATLANFMGHQK